MRNSTSSGTHDSRVSARFGAGARYLPCPAECAILRGLIFFFSSPLRFPLSLWVGGMADVADATP
jgi:hypothetical protein